MFTLEDLKKQGIVVNPNARGNQPSFTITKQNQTQLDKDVEDDESFLDRTKRGLKETFVDMPIAMKKAFTGEDKPIEFPNLREITKLDDIGFWEDLLAEGKIGAVRDDTAKAEVFENTFKGDKRYGGVFKDKFDNLAIQWNNDFYYVNKPGLTDADMNTFAMEIVKFLPVSKIMNKTKGLARKIGVGTTGYTATEFLSGTLEDLLAPKTAQAKNETLGEKGVESLKLGSLATAIDIATPPSLKFAKEGAKAVVRGTSKAVGVKPPDFVKGTITQTSKFPLTEGQRTADLGQTGVPTANKLNPELQEEEMFRFAQGMDTKVAGGGVIKAFDAQQLDLIKQDAKSLADEFGTGTFGKQIDQVDGTGEMANIGQKSIEEVRDIITAETGRLKNIAKTGYNTIKNAKNIPFVSKEGLINLRKQFTSPDFQLLPIELKNLPKTADIQKYLNDTLNGAIKSGKPLDFRVLQRIQKAVNQIQRSAEKGSPDAVQAGNFKNTLDNFVFNGIDNGFIQGNDNIINTLKESNEAYAQYIKLSGKGGGDARTKAILSKIVDEDLAPSKIVDEDLAPTEIVNSFLGHSKFNPKPVMKKVLNTIKANIPDDKKQEVFALLKDAVLEKAFSGVGKSGITRTNIVNNFNDIFEKNAFFTKELFTPKEIARIKQFRKDVLPTLFAEIKSNPSGTSYTLLASLQRGGLLSYGKYLATLPMVKEMAEGAQVLSQRQRAVDLTKRYFIDSRKPLLIASEIPASTTPVREELIGVDDVVPTEDNEDILKFIQDIPLSAQKKIIDTGDFE